ncbi:carbohydrate ABC transporter permease [Yinghuangia soli]|uniref:Sugar ABC transporter permease n=1 Tax=Yinghuangia soli TaxID=2908204 RepID=A0AA41U1B9_9ACTN|nr:sugar ABC transporter permease [Yinghuangia soli]MCF2529395.1 sugar ABC transporter permease [Yinghuangia soli]
MRKTSGRRRSLGPLPWIGPAVLLIALIVLWPVVEMVRSSFLRIRRSGVVRGYNGTDNYERLFDEPDFGQVLWNTAVWVVSVVGITIVLSLALAQLFNQHFPGRRVTRWALIIPWAASVFMTAIVFRWMLHHGYGAINTLLVDLHILDEGRDWLGEPSTAFPWMIAVGVFVSLPFTTYTLLAGLQTIPGEVYEAARMDGASPWRTYLSITLPLLRPAVLVAVVINLINVFNSFPIIWAMTGGGPGYETDTTTTYMYKLKVADIGESAALSVVNFGLVIVLVVVYLRVSRWNREAD